MPPLRGHLLAMLLAAAAGAVPWPCTAAGVDGQRLEAKLERLGGGRLRLSELRGQPLVLELWATWCLPCQEQARILHDLVDELSARRVAVLAVNEGEAQEVVRDYLERRPSDFPVVLDRRQVLASRLGVGELPALALLDRDGTVVGVRLGITRQSELLALLAAVDDDGSAGAVERGLACSAVGPESDSAHEPVEVAGSREFLNRDG